MRNFSRNGSPCGKNVLETSSCTASAKAASPSGASAVGTASIIIAVKEEGDDQECPVTAFTSQIFQTFTSKIPVPVSGYPFFLRKQIQKTIQNSTKKPKQQNQKKWHAKCHQADWDKDHCQDQYKTDDISQNLHAVFPPLFIPMYSRNPSVLDFAGKTSLTSMS